LAFNHLTLKGLKGCRHNVRPYGENNSSFYPKLTTTHMWEHLSIENSRNTLILI